MLPGAPNASILWLNVLVQTILFRAMICLRDVLLAVFIFGVSVVNLSPTEVNAQSLQVLTPDPELNAAIDAGSVAVPFRADAGNVEGVMEPAFATARAGREC